MLNYSNQIEQFFRSQQGITTKEIAEERAQNELVFLDAPVCPEKELKFFLSRHYYMDYDEIEKFIKYFHRQSSVMTTLSCLFMSNSILIGENGEKLILEDYFNENIKNLHKIGTKSAYGVVLRGQLDDRDITFTIKANKNSTEEANALALHEYTVGYFLNMLRNKVPNFVYTYGCFRKDNKLWVMYEDLGNGISAGEYARKGALYAFSAIAQVAIATEIAYKEYGFTHYDLHPGNVIMKPQVDYSKFYIAYLSRDGTYRYVFADSLAMIIDYGSCFINGYSTPEVNANAYGKYNKALPIADMYKFVFFLLNDCLSRKTKGPLLNLLYYLSKFFVSWTNEAEIHNFVLAQRKYKFTYADIGQHKSLVEFINYLFNYADARRVIKTDISASSTPLLQEKRIFSLSRVRDLFISSEQTTVPPNTYFTLYYMYLNNGIIDIPEGFSTTDATADITKLIEMLTTKYNSIVSVPPQEVIDSNYMTEYPAFRNYYEATLELFSLLGLVIETETVLNFVRENLVVAEELPSIKEFKYRIVTSLKLSLASFTRSIHAIEHVLSQTTNPNTEALIWYKQNIQNIKELSSRSIMHEEDIIMEEPKRKRKGIIATEKGSVYTRNKTFR